MMPALQDYHGAQPQGLLFSESIHTFSAFSTKSGLPVPTTVGSPLDQRTIVIEVTQSSSISKHESAITDSSDQALSCSLEIQNQGEPQHGSNAGKSLNDYTRVIGIHQYISRKRRSWQTAFSTFFELTNAQEITNILSPHAARRGVPKNKFPICGHQSWLFGKGCRWLVDGSSCLAQWRRTTYQGTNAARLKQEFRQSPKYASTRTEERQTLEYWFENQRILPDIPKYVLDHAPLVHLFSAEKYWPCDMAEHLYHVSPELNYTLISETSDSLNLTNLGKLNQWSKGRFVYLTSNDNVEGRPDWLGGEKNIPNITYKSAPEERSESPRIKRNDILRSGNPNEVAMSEDWYEAPAIDTKIRRKDLAVPLKHSPLVSLPQESDESLPKAAGRRETISHSAEDRHGGRSDAPAVLIVIDKGEGVVDAFWFYFYSFNLGNEVLNIRFGNHVGDWEHSMVRFKNGKPKAVYLSEHNFGAAYSYAAMEKRGKRPVIYSATGTHAMYATPGTHTYILPLGLLRDQTDRGPLWDPLLNSHMYTYNYINDTLRSSNITPNAPTDWFYFAGHWGDKFYPMNDRRQYQFAGQYHYVNGPLGPRFKHLGRRKVCEGRDSDPCTIKNWIGLRDNNIRWKGQGEGDDWS